MTEPEYGHYLVSFGHGQGLAHHYIEFFAVSSYPVREFMRDNFGNRYSSVYAWDDEGAHNLRYHYRYKRLFTVKLNPLTDPEIILNSYRGISL